MNRRATNIVYAAYYVQMKRVVLTGGGTGGHIYPCLALLPELNKRGFAVTYVGGEGDTPEKRAAERAGLPYFGLPVIKLNRSLSPSAFFNNLKIPFLLPEYVSEAVELAKKIKPDVVFSKGGYASLPFTLAALKLNIPVICHESDLTEGVANKLAAKRGARLLAANPHSDFGEFVGMPLRRELFSISKEQALKKLKTTGVDVENGKKTVLVVGGSSGAKTLNELIEKNLIMLTEKYNVIHLYGNKSDYVPKIVKGYLALPYSDDMPVLYAAADLVISRAGATAVAEISALKKRAIFIPLPKRASRGDQIYNAELAKEYGAISLLEDDTLNGRFLPALDKCFSAPPMRPIFDDSNGKIADIINASIGRGDLCKNKKQ